MPVTPTIQTKRIPQSEFKCLAYEVMKHVFAIHNDFGRLFDEKVDKRELASRMRGVSVESRVDVSHRDFTKPYFADVIIERSGLFEFKAAECIHPRHESQAINYLLLFDLIHGKVVNVRPERVQHQFVNCQQRLRDLRNPVVHDDGWDSTVPGAEFFRDTLMALIHDWGAGLVLPVYTEAITHFAGGEDVVYLDVPVFGASGQIAVQPAKLVAPNIGFELTALRDEDNSFAPHARRLIEHTDLRAIHWANITPQAVTFTTIR